ncbi:hypothetical protein HanXRQr2_Chr17g0786551 [Helianthus annuus]|uniref:Uncharacterized protein n=1 Tax=Helianthus annuus TaxID=4232 RepID=A0A9K3DEI1_HELAN|nr:hypothetical protein HanXRQr2_Chr17g0786551 [Helianthus annuus]KAJ0811796.1 hypothetical protein HanPSC8_Chr17g0754751 [Helianthus annuus]
MNRLSNNWGETKGRAAMRIDSISSLGKFFYCHSLFHSFVLQLSDLLSHSGLND